MLYSREQQGKQEMNLPHEIYGVDFSGAKDAGKKIWIAQGLVRAGSLLIRDCFPARALPNSGTSREECLPALRGFIVKSQNAAFGLDFPFGLPGHMVRESRWEGFITSFDSNYESSQAFRKICSQAGGGAERKRVTDVESRAPFSPYNLRMYRQTYHGISGLLRPLVGKDLARVLPMQKPSAGKPVILEACPASTLKALYLYGPYKNKGSDDRGARRAFILERLEKIGPLRVESRDLRQSIAVDRGGDALDSVIAAFAVFRALRGNAGPAKADEDYRVEGYVYV
jgi:hypothetical protein